jgi:hypothetical protein
MWKTPGKKLAKRLKTKEFGKRGVRCFKKYAFKRFL